MLSHTILLSALLATLAAAQTNACTGDKSTVGHCETLSYIDRTTTASDPPLATDCQDTCRGVLSDAGDWSVTFNGQAQSYRQNLISYPCSFSVGPASGQPKNTQFFLANQDIIDILDEVNKRFAPLHGGKVAAEGTIKCDGKVANWYVQ